MARAKTAAAPGNGKPGAVKKARPAARSQRRGQDFGFEGTNKTVAVPQPDAQPADEGAEAAGLFFKNRRCYYAKSLLRRRRAGRRHQPFETVISQPLPLAPCLSRCRSGCQAKRQPARLFLLKQRAPFINWPHLRIWRLKLLISMSGLPKPRAMR